MLATFALGSSSHAGLGTIEDGKLNLLVYFAYDETDPMSWEPVFTEYSRLLLNATEGGLQLGTVQFTVCPDFQDEADVWVLNDFSGARAHLFGLGQRGLHITISQTHKSTSGGALGQFGLAHETGHYVWGCYDEYRGWVGNVMKSDPNHNCTLSPSTVACLMDGGTTVSPENTRTEFCTSKATGFPGTVHNTGVMVISGGGVKLVAAKTDQEYYLGRSCWEQIQLSGRGGLTHPPSEPPQSILPHDPVVFDLARFQGDLAIAIVLDRSGSMSAEGRLDNAVLGAKSAVGLLRDGEGLAIVAFDDTPQTIFRSSSMSDANKANANAALDALVAGGGTSLGTALQAAVSELASLSGCVEPIVVISDGVSADPQADDPTILAALNAGDHAVYAVAVGSFADVAALNAVATATGGQFFAVDDASELPGVLASIFASAGYGTPVLESYEEGVPALGVRSRAFDVGENVEALRVSLAFADGADLGLSLRTPSGDTFAFATPPAGVTTFASGVQKTMTVARPEPGTWTATVDESFGVAASFDLLAYVEGLALDITTSVAEPSVAFPAPMRVSVHVVAGVPVGDARVTGEVRRPDGFHVAVTFHDDGSAAHGDAVAGDGVYSTLFARYGGDGAYAFQIEVDGTNAMAASNLECGVYGAGEDGQTPMVIPPFRACTSRTVLLSGAPTVPSSGSATLRAHDVLAPAFDVDLERAPVPIAGFVLDVAPDEPLFLASIDVDIRRPGDAISEASFVELHLDADADGRIDVPSVPLAIGSVTGGRSTLRFASATGALAFLGAGDSHWFLLTAGGGIEPQPAQGRLAASPGAAGGTTSLGAGSGAAHGVALALLVLVAVRASRRENAPRAWRAASVLALFAALAIAFPACSGGDHGGDALELRASATGIQFEGAVTGNAIRASGPALRFSTRLE